VNLNWNILRLLFALLLFGSRCALAQEFPIHHFGVAEGLPADGVYDLLQDQSGYLWVATEGGGLVRFDGQDFENMDAPEALTSANVRCLFEDHQGMIWAGTAEPSTKDFQISTFGVSLKTV
jgi:ligand-binding sensor domain-containing protein